MCERCRAEYEDPLDRRFHAQPNACPECGPRVRLVDASGAALPGRPGDRDPVEAAAGLLAAGGILAIKGIGGCHLACAAGDERAVSALRARKRREQKPLALMAADLEEARALVELTPAEEALLTDRVRPIVIARRRADARVAASVAPGWPDLGVMLPYSPLHHLLAADVGGPLVMTCGNVSEEPIAYRDDEARDAAADDRRRLPRPRPADPHAHRRPRAPIALALPALGAADAAPLPRPRAGERAAAAAGAASGAGLRRRAQEHLLPGEGRACLGRPSHRRPEELGDAELVPRGRSSTSSACSGSSPSWSPTISTPTTSRPATRWPARGWSCSGSSTITPTSPPAWPSTASAAARSARSSTAAATGPTGRSGAGSCWSATCAPSSGRASSSRSACRAATPRCASPGGWPVPG